MKIWSYPKIWNLGHPQIADLFTSPVVVEEKVDGSQFSFQRVGDDVFFRSRNCQVFPGSGGMFEDGIQAILKLRDLLEDGWVYRGEYLRRPKHNTLAYERVPRHHVALWDIETGPSRFLGRAEKVEEAEKIGLEFVPLFFEGLVKDPSAFRRLMDQQSFLGGQIEGLVFKNYSRFGLDGKILAGKHVSEAFKETNKVTNKATTQSDIKAEIGAMLCSEARWAKAIFRLRDQGKLTDSPADIGPLLKEIQQDVETEDADAAKNRLWQWARKDVLRASSRGFAEFYKNRLLERQFETVQ